MTGLHKWRTRISLVIRITMTTPLIEEVAFKTADQKYAVCAQKEGMMKTVSQLQTVITIGEAVYRADYCPRKTRQGNCGCGWVGSGSWLVRR